jgi:hypothetical protein
MKKILIPLIVLVLAFVFTACQDDSITSAQAANATATAQEMFTRIPSDIPVMEGAYNLRVSSSSNNVSYRVQAIFEDVIKYYQEQTVTMGWEQLGGEQVMSDSITMQRTKPDKNMSILISAVQDSDEVLVQVMIASR